METCSTQLQTWSAGREKKNWEVYSAKLGRKSTFVQPLGNLERQEQLANKLAQVASDPDAQADLIQELQGNLVSSERVIAGLQGSTRQARKSRDAAKSSMVNENMHLLKVSACPCPS